jgi:predicted NAD/FAD-dependent oxidoreductase
MSLTTFNQLTHWLLNTDTSQEINMFERVLVTQTLPEVAQNNVVELNAKQIFDQ